MSLIQRVAARYLRATARSLYHGTIRDHARSIQQGGLYPSVGDFVRDSYGTSVDEDQFDEIVFAADKRGIGQAMGAIIAHTAKKLGKQFGGVTEEDILKHGMLVKIDPEEVEYFERKPESWEPEDFYAEYPVSVEPGDYYTREPVGITWILTGKKMLKFFERFGEWPRKRGPLAPDRKTENLRKQLIQKAHRWNKLTRQHNPRDLVQCIREMPPDEVKSQANAYDWLWKTYDLAIKYHRKKGDKNVRTIQKELTNLSMEDLNRRFWGYQHKLQNLRTAATRLAGLVEPPPQLVKEITDWAATHIANVYSRSAKAYFNNRINFEEADDLAADVQAQAQKAERALDDYDLETGLTHVRKAWSALNEPLMDRAARRQLEGYIGERAAKPYRSLGSQKFQEKPRDKQIRNARWVLTGIRSALMLFLNEIGLEQNRTGWTLELEDQLILFDKYDRGSWSNQQDETSRGFLLNTRGWKYNRLPGMAGVRDLVIPVRLIPDSWSKVSGAWNSNKHSMALSYPTYSVLEKNERTFKRAFEDLGEVVHHECIHVAQYLFELAGIPAGGMPSSRSKRSPYQQYWGRYEDEYNQEEEERQIRRRLRSEGVDLQEVSFHSLDDVEFYSNLADQIKDFKRHFRKGRDLSDQIKRFMDTNEFFKSLRVVSDQRRKFKKAVKLLWSSMQTS